MAISNREEIDLSRLRGAIFSDDGQYRYALWRVWNRNLSLLLQIGLNPSKAGAEIDDPTVTRNMARAYKEGFGGLLQGNLYGYVSTNPDELLGNGDFGWFIGELTDYYLRQMIKMSGRQLCGWGSFKAVPLRAPIVLSMISEPYCLGVNGDGQPKHPLYVAYNVPMVRYQCG